MAALNSPVLTMRDLLNLEDRIEAHLEGLLLGGENMVQLVLPGLSDSDSNVAFAAAYTLLRSGQNEAAERVWSAFTLAQGDALKGLCQALCACCPMVLKARIVETGGSGASPVALAALEVMAFQWPTNIRQEWLAAFLKAELPELRRGGWRVVALAAIALPRQSFDAALVDKDTNVHSECLQAAAWTRQPWLLDYCRQSAAGNPPDLAAIRLLSVLGGPEDLQRLLYFGTDTAFGSQRFQWLGAYGHPQVVDAILAGFKCQNPREAVAAGNAFTKITCFDVASATRVQLLPEDGHEPDEFEKEFLDVTFLSDFEKARACWQGVKEQFAKGTRWRYGYDFSQSAVLPKLELLDNASRLESVLRVKFLESRQDMLADIRRHPVMVKQERTQVC